MLSDNVFSEKEKMKAQLSTLKPALMLHDSEKDMLADILIQIDFRICDSDLETLVLFFKRIYSGIEALRKEREELKLNLKELQDELEKLKPNTNEDSLNDYVVSPV